MSRKIMVLICGSALLFGCSSLNPFSKKEPIVKVLKENTSPATQEPQNVAAPPQQNVRQQEESPKLVEAEYGYWVYEHHGRLYVIGQAITNHQFRKSGHLPYTRTILGSGPAGETVVLEVNKKDPQLVERLQAKFLKQPMLLESDKDYWVYEHEGRHYVVGQAKTKEQFITSGHLPYTRTILGAGPQGETVVFEVNKKDSRLVERLVNTYNLK